MSRNGTEENKHMYKSMNNKAKKAVSNAIGEKAEGALTELENCPNGMFRVAKWLILIAKKLKEEVMQSSVLVRRKEVNSGSIIKNGS